MQQITNRVQSMAAACLENMSFDAPKTRGPSPRLMEAHPLRIPITGMILVSHEEGTEMPCRDIAELYSTSRMRSVAPGYGHKFSKVSPSKAVTHSNTNSDERKRVQDSIKNTDEPGEARRSQQVNAGLGKETLGRCR